MRKRNELIKGLYCITCEERSAGRSALETAGEMLAAGAKILQYREKRRTKREKYRDCSALRALTREHGALFIVNDDVDIALAVKADGAHLGQDDLPVEAARSILGPEAVIGVSTHSPAQALEAARRGADYIGVGPLYPTLTKEDVCAAVGLGYLDYVAGNLRLPFVAIGGIKLHNLEEVLRHGARCAALVTEITEAPDIKGRVGEALEILARQERRSPARTG
ncbi:MAG: thiamine phosphate synthase [Elusimicrobia bacterium]|nr:thiamine phosphate synthase [Elusimicrobiota bacterium]